MKTSWPGKEAHSLERQEQQQQETRKVKGQTSTCAFPFMSSCSECVWDASVLWWPRCSSVQAAGGGEGHRGRGGLQAAACRQSEYGLHTRFQQTYLPEPLLPCWWWRQGWCAAVPLSDREGGDSSSHRCAQKFTQPWQNVSFFATFFSENVNDTFKKVFFRSW